MELHYVCIGGCGKTSQTQDKCNSIGCWRARNPLAECDCTDGKHTEFYKIYKTSIADSEEIDGEEIVHSNLEDAHTIVDADIFTPEDGNSNASNSD